MEDKEKEFSFLIELLRKHISTNYGGYYNERDNKHVFYCGLGDANDNTYIEIKSDNSNILEDTVVKFNEHFNRATMFKEMFNKEVNRRLYNV